MPKAKEKKIVENVYKRLLREYVPDLGKVQFSPQRLDGAPKDEPNTEEEQDLLKNLKRWVKDVSIDKYTINQLKSLMSSKKYGQFFHPPQGDIVYRGMALTAKQISHLVDIPEEEIGEEGEINKRIILENRNEAGVSSWTRDEKTAEEFAQMNVDDMMFTRTGEKKKKYYVVVFTAQVEDNKSSLFDLQSIKDKVDGFLYMGEDEVLSFEPVVVTSVRWSS